MSKNKQVRRSACTLRAIFSLFSEQSFCLPYKGKKLTELLGS